MLLYIGLIFLGVVLIALLGVPIGFAFAIGAAVMLAVFSIEPQWALAQAFKFLQSYVLLALPLYLLLGILIDRAGIAERIASWGSALFGKLKGGLGVATIVTNGIFGAMSGMAVAALAAIGKALLPSMEKEGYPKEYAIALLIPASTLVLMIPPSSSMIMFGFTFFSSS